MHVAMLVPLFPPSYGGAGLQAEWLAKALGTRGVEITVLSTRPPGSRARRDERTSFGRVRRFPAPRSLRGIDLVLGMRAAGWLATSSFDLLHVHTVAYFAVLPALVARLRGRPYLLKTSLLGGDDLAHVARGRLGALLVAAYRKAQAVVALSDPIENGLREDGRLEARVVRISNGVDTAHFRPPRGDERQRARAELGLPADALVLLSSGELGVRKGTAELLEAAGRMDGRPRVLALAGPEDLHAPRLRRALAEVPPELRVRRLGELSPDALATWLRAADVFVLNSRAEGLPNALLEAAASGLACVSTDIGGSREVLSGDAGVLVPPGDGPALVAALDKLAADPALRSRLGERARERALERFSLERVADAYLSLYRDLLAGHHAR